MFDPNTGLPPRLLPTRDAARFLGVSMRTLEKHRGYGTGPRYIKLGGRIVYAVEDLQTWAQAGRRTSTTEKTKTHVSAARRLTEAERKNRTGAR
jgi:predicted DNA-binding transcriptional regulator AlpA